MYNIKIHKVLRDGPKNKTIPSFEIKDHVKYKYTVL